LHSISDCYIFTKKIDENYLNSSTFTKTDMPRFDKPTRDEVLAKYEKDYMERLAADGKIELTEKMSAELAKNAITFDDYEKEYLERYEKGQTIEYTVEKTSETVEPETVNLGGAMPKGWKPPTEPSITKVEETVAKVDNEIDDLKKELTELTVELESERKELKSIKPKKKPSAKKTGKKKRSVKPKKKPSTKKTGKKKR